MFPFRFKLNKELDSEKSPRAAPVITQVLPLGPTSLRYKVIY